MSEHAGGLARFEATLRDFWATRPVRPRSGGKLAGVSAGIGNRYGIDPILVRVGFALLTFYGGSGLVLYLLGWLLLPKEVDRGDSPARESTPAPVAAVLVLLLMPVMIFWVQSFAGLVGLLAGFGALYLLHRHYADRGSAALGSPGTGTAAPADTANTWVYPGSTEQRHPPEWDPLGAAQFAWDLPEPPAQEPEPEPEPPARRWIGFGTLLLAVAAAGLALLAGYGPAATCAAALAVVGAGMITGSFLGSGRGLIGVAIPLGAVALLLSALGPLHVDPSAETRHIRPSSTAELEPSYESAAGGVELDLTDLPADEGRQARTKVSSGAGDVVVRVPDDAEVTASCSTRVGSVDCLGRVGASGGPGSTTRTAQDPGEDGSDGARIAVELSADVGDVEVRRD
ncbi:PspC domain-containing protein [Saccharopolyspora sp. HNM0983]|uniref:PspC domain-containing protein n=1 Tax=Saccharopolyspora montiporae TaxID=2781240 RepID=A0A929G1V6_9PSEU|nr:PspC domain-containing protein [Saccharopolyspora sp. HNM0983]MBE9375068.1 PspC domain-containing protein [Saccharopolyspora sp. HNM0983]